MSAAAVYEVPSISCNHCKQTIEGGLVAVEGVASVSVDVEAKTVRVEGSATPELVRAALDDLGYAATAVDPV